MHTEYMTQELINTPDHRYNNLTPANPGEFTLKESIPPYVIPENHLALMLFEEEANLKLYNISFVNDQLHIHTKGTFKIPMFKDSTATTIAPIYMMRTGESGYFVYPITPNMLSDLTCFITIEKEITRLNETW